MENCLKSGMYVDETFPTNVTIFCKQNKHELQNKPDKLISVQPWTQMVRMHDVSAHIFVVVQQYFVISLMTS
jgi:hypothetical protein